MKAARFYADCEGHIDNPAMKQALEELQFTAQMEASQYWQLSSKPRLRPALFSLAKKLKKLVYAVHFTHNLRWKVGWTNGQGDQARSERKQPQSAQAGHPAFHALPNDCRYKLPSC